MLDSAPRVRPVRPPVPPRVLACGLGLLVMLLATPPDAGAQSFSGEPIDQAYVSTVARPRSAQVVTQIRSRAEQGDAQAQNSLAHLYEMGDGVEQSYSEALSWYRLAANQGQPAAQESLAHFYLHGHGVPADLGVATNLYRAAAEQGRASSQTVLGILRAHEGDAADAVRWFREAIAKGDPAAHNNLAVMYESGRGVPKSVAQAERLYRVAAQKGDAEAASSLERLKDG